jgi:peroxiredoxin
MKRLVIACCAVLSIVLLSVPAAAQTRQKIDVPKLGPQVGEKVPDFSLKDQNGKTQTLESIMGPKGAMLIFVRSADWCPYCKTQLLELQSQLPQLQARGLGVASISYDSEAIVAAFSKQRGITYPMLADVGSVTIKKFGILNPLPELALSGGGDDPELKAEVAKYVSGFGARQQQVGMAFPGAFFIDRSGRVTARFFEDAYVERNTVSNLLVKLGARPAVAGTKTSTAHLDVTAYVSDESVAAGNHFSVVLDVQPHAHLHVYAPGAEKNGYRVVAFKLDPHPQVRELGAHYPASEIYDFKPLKERVPVYQKPFRLTQELVLDGSAASQQALKGKDAITVTGVLAYQACDDKMCFNPVSVPLSWKVNLRALLRDPPAPARETSSVGR